MNASNVIEIVAVNSIRNSFSICASLRLNCSVAELLIVKKTGIIFLSGCSS